MSMEKGQLSIHTENFLPIIKKWLYSDRDIFIRELISNCCDAVAKRRMVGQIPDDYQPRVTVRVDKEHRILSFTDNGVGMTAEEVRKYINQVAFSGANDFMEKYKDSGEQIIGHFGLGFYSALMVADKVRIDTLSCLGIRRQRRIHDGGNRARRGRHHRHPVPQQRVRRVPGWQYGQINHPQVLLLHAHAHLLRGGRGREKA